MSLILPAVYLVCGVALAEIIQKFDDSVTEDPITCTQYINIVLLWPVVLAVAAVRFYSGED